MSFSSDIKEYLLSLREKRDCCMRSLLYGIYVGCGEDTGSEIVFSMTSEKCAHMLCETIATIFPVFPAVSGRRTVAAGAQEHDCLVDELGITNGLNLSVCKCEACPEAFIRGLYIGCARITDPSKGYHLELAVRERYFEAVRSLLGATLREPKVITRRSEKALYYKSSATAEEFLTYIGAGKYALWLMEEKIIKDMHNEANRKANCEIANLDKAATAAAAQLAAVKKLQKSCMLKELPPVLYETAMLRLEFEELSLEELRMKFDPPISKSGLSHRFERIIALADKSQ